MSESFPTAPQQPEEVDLEALLQQQEQAHVELSKQQEAERAAADAQARQDRIATQTERFVGDVSTDGKSHSQLNKQTKRIKQYADVKNWIADAQNAESEDELLATSSEKAAPTNKELVRDFALSGLAGNEEIQKFIKNKANNRTANYSDEDYDRLDAKADAYQKARELTLEAMKTNGGEEASEHNARQLDAIEKAVQRRGIKEVAKDFGIDLGETEAEVEPAVEPTVEPAPEPTPEPTADETKTREPKAEAESTATEPAPTVEPTKVDKPEASAETEPAGKDPEADEPKAEVEPTSEPAAEPKAESEPATDDEPTPEDEDESGESTDESDVEESDTEDETDEGKKEKKSKRDRAKVTFLKWFKFDEKKLNAADRYSDVSELTEAQTKVNDTTAEVPKKKEDGKEVYEDADVDVVYKDAPSKVIVDYLETDENGPLLDVAAEAEPTPDVTPDEPEATREIPKAAERMEDVARTRSVSEKRRKSLKQRVASSITGLLFTFGTANSKKNENGRLSIFDEDDKKTS